MTDRTFDNLDFDTGQQWPVDADIPDARALPDDFWSRPIRNIQVEGGRL